MIRVCGAPKQRTPAEQRKCWCLGLFCGRGGSVLSKRFRAESRKSITVSSRRQYADLVQQADLFEGDALREKWLELLERGRIYQFSPRAQAAAAEARQGGGARALEGSNR